MIVKHAKVYRIAFRNEISVSHHCTINFKLNSMRCIGSGDNVKYKSYCVLLLPILLLPIMPLSNNIYTL